MVGVLEVLYTGIYEVLIEFLDLEDVHELTSVSLEWRRFLGGSFQRFWRRASVHKFGLRFDLVRILEDCKYILEEGVEQRPRGLTVKNWFSYFDILSSSDLSKFLINQRKINMSLVKLLYTLKIEGNTANTRFALQNSPNIGAVIDSVGSLGGYFEKFLPLSDYSERVTSICEILRENDKTVGDFNSEESVKGFSKIELDLGGLGRGYLWEMNVVSVTSQSILVRSEFHLDDLPYWDTGKILIEYVAVWGLIRGKEHLLLYHHKNPFHNNFQSQSIPQYSALMLPDNAITSNFDGINYFMSNLGSFAGIEMSFDDKSSKFTIYVTLQVSIIMESLSRYLSNSCDLYRLERSKSNESQENEANFGEDLSYLDFELENTSTQDSFPFSEDENFPIPPGGESQDQDPSGAFELTLPFLAVAAPKSKYNIELQLMDGGANIPMYLYGDLEPISRKLNTDFAELRVHFGKSYPNSSLIKTNCLYQAGLSIIDKLTGEIVLSMVFPRSKSYYEKRNTSKSRRLLRFCSYARIYGVHVPIIDPPSFLTTKPESVLSKLEILIRPHRNNSLGKISELSLYLNVQECMALFPVKKLKRFLKTQCYQFQESQNKRKLNSPIKRIHKH
ncbi:hypothetical protein HWI79_924 [Cryptosporidium felis]|nr:hypothetical protein HWI79_924 [Cryptosporidium felis]